MIYKGANYEVIADAKGLHAVFIKQQMVVGTTSKSPTLSAAMFQIQIDALIDMERKPLEVGDIVARKPRGKTVYYYVVKKINRSSIHLREGLDHNDMAITGRGRLVSFNGVCKIVPRKKLKYETVESLKFNVIGTAETINKDTKVWVEA